MSYFYMKQRERFIIWFWQQLPDSWLYWAVNQAWAKATCTKFTDRHPDQVLWSDMQKFLSNKGMSKHQIKKFGIALKPCPFCGKRYKGTNIAAPGLDHFECPYCGAKGPLEPHCFQTTPFKYDDEALKLDIAVIESWNRRVTK